MSDFIGPPLPPELQQRPSASQGVDTSRIVRSSPETTCSYGPSLPPQDSTNLQEIPPSIGPRLPPCEARPDGQTYSEIELKTEAGPSSYGPCLPPGFVVDDESTRERVSKVEDVEQTDGTGIVGPVLPPGFGDVQEEEEDEYIIGPMPVKGGAEVT